MHPTNHDDEELRRLVEREVKAQLAPVTSMLTTLHDWQTSFWSNGSGRPPGFFQMRVKSDDERYGRLLEYQEAQTKELARQSDIADRMDDYIKAEKVRKEYKDKQWKRWKPILKWVGGGLCTAVIGFASWVGPHIMRVADILWQDYLKYHPAVSEKLKTASTGLPQANASTQVHATDTPSHY